MNASRLILKSAASVFLLAAFVIIASFAVLIAPLYLLLIVKGKAKAAIILPTIPLGIIGGMLWKIWKTDGMSDTERAYYDGIREGQLKGSRIAGRIEGVRSIAVREDLSLKPVYSTRRQLPLRRSSQTNDIPY